MEVFAQPLQTMLNLYWAKDTEDKHLPSLLFAIPSLQG